MKKKRKKPGFFFSTNRNQGADNGTNTTGAHEKSNSGRRRHRPVNATQAKTTAPGITRPIRPFDSMASAAPNPASAVQPNAFSPRSRACKNSRRAKNVSVKEKLKIPSVRLSRVKANESGADRKMSAAHHPASPFSRLEIKNNSRSAVPRPARRSGRRAA